MKMPMRYVARVKELQRAGFEVVYAGPLLVGKGDPKR